jgi:hypothetical protein
VAVGTWTSTLFSRSILIQNGRAAFHGGGFEVARKRMHLMRGKEGAALEGGATRRSRRHVASIDAYAVQRVFRMYGIVPMKLIHSCGSPLSIGPPATRRLMPTRRPFGG